MRGLVSTFAAAVLGGGVTAAVLLGAGWVDDGDQSGTAEPPFATRGAAMLAAAESGGMSVREIYSRSASAVVFVRARTLQSPPSPFDVGAQSAEATGSGFVIDAEKGLIVTNAHVVDAATQVEVTLSEEQTVSARAVGKDADTDLALLRVDPEGLDLRALPLGDSGTVQVGDPTVAIGNPFGLERTLTTGYVSALQPRLTAPSGFGIKNVIQTDAALTPGNSGGPLLDVRGRVVGINSQMATASPDGSGGTTVVGFAVPVNTAKQIVPDLEEAGHVERAFLGVQGATAPDGVLVEHVEPGSPAAAAGVSEGDVLETLGGRKVRTMDDVDAVLEAHKPGDVLDLELRTGGLPRGIEATLADRPDALAAE